MSPIENARSRAAGLSAMIMMDIAEALNLTPDECQAQFGDYAEVFAAGVYISGKMNRMAHVGALVYIASQLP